MTANAIRTGGILLAIAFPAAIVWSYAELLALESGAMAATEQAQECVRLSEAIRKLSPSGPTSEKAAAAPVELGRQIEAIVKLPQWSGVQLVRVDPQAPKRISDSAFSERTTHVELRQVHLRQFVLLMDELKQQGCLSHLRKLRLQAPLRAEATNQPEMWSVEMALTDRLLTPKTSAPTAGRTNVRR